MRSISGISSWQAQLPRVIGPARAEALAPVTPVEPSRRNTREATGSLYEHAIQGEYLSAKAASALPPVDFSRRVFDTLVRAVHSESEDANAGLAIKAVHAYLLAATPINGATGLRIDGYA